MTKQGALLNIIILGLAGTGVTAHADDTPKPYMPSGKYTFLNDVTSPSKSLGWTEADKEFWYAGSQGSRFIPYNWLAALEQTGNTQKFLDKNHMQTFGYIEANGSLPVGFSIDVWKKSEKYGTYSKPSPFKSNEWVGLTCAACHTGHLTHKGERFVVHGAPAMSDFLQFIDGVLDAVNATLSDDQKFGRFQKEILGANADQTTQDALRASLTEYAQWRTKIQNKNGNIGPGIYGYGRLDAVGHILSQVSLVAGKNEDNDWKSDAPVSYPHIWNAPQQALVQWNGLASNSANPVKTGDEKLDFGALGRNVGEVTGVFADFTATPKDDGKKFKVRSSARSDNIIKFEQKLGRLPSPQWPFEPIKGDLWADGKVLYDQHCVECHTVVGPNDMTTKFPEMKAEDTGDKIVMDWLHEVGTDIWMACNSDQYGVKRTPDGAVADPNQPVTDMGAYQLAQVVTGTVIGQLDKVAKSALKDIFGIGGQKIYTAPSQVPTTVLEVSPDAIKVPNKKIAAANDCLEKSFYGERNNVLQDYKDKKAAWKKKGFFGRLFAKKQKKALKAAKAESDKYRLLRYKARPLNGIWATAPYLHNGSVPTLEALLRPSRQSDATGLMQYRPYTQSTNMRMITAMNRLNKQPPSSDYRPDCFYVGDLEYDTANVGYVSPECKDGPPISTRSFKFRVVDDKGNVIPGNSNAGHNYPKTPLSTDNREALLEYLKSL